MGSRRRVTNRAVFLDRDGVLNQTFVREGRPYPPSSLRDLKLLPRVKEALTRLKKENFLLIVITNQPDVARGITSKELVDDINAKLLGVLPLDDVKTCYHDTSDGCVCRKPEPGAIIDASAEYDVDLSVSFMVGDRWKDIEAGHRAGCRTIFIDYEYNEPRPIQFDYQSSSLFDAVDFILGENRND